MAPQLGKHGLLVERDQVDRAAERAGHDAPSVAAEAHRRQRLVADLDPRQLAAAAGIPEQHGAGAVGRRHARAVRAEARREHDRVRAGMGEPERAPAGDAPDLREAIVRSR